MSGGESNSESERSIGSGGAIRSAAVSLRGEWTVEYVLKILSLFLVACTARKRVTNIMASPQKNKATCSTEERMVRQRATVKCVYVCVC